jgi:MFS family permease
MVRPSPNRALIPLGIGITLSLLGDQTLYTVLPNPGFAAQAGVTLGMVGILLGVNRLVRVLFNGPMGILYDRLPRRGLMIASIGIGAISTWCYVLSTGQEFLLLGRVLWGVAWSGIWIGSNTMALDISDDQNRGRITGRLQMWFFLGVATASLAGGLFTDIFGFQGGLWVSAGLSSAAVFLWILFLPETRPEKVRDRNLEVAEYPEKPFPWRVAIRASVPLFVLRVVFAGVLASTTILWLGQFVDGGLPVLGILLPLATLTGIFVAVRMLISMVSAPVTGYLSDRTGRRWAIIAILMMVGTVSLFLMGAEFFWLAMVGVLFSAVMGGGVQSLVPAVVGDQVGAARQSRVLSVVFTIGDIGSALGPPIALALIPLFGVGGIYRFCGLLCGLAGIFALHQARSRRSRRS